MGQAILNGIATPEADNAGAGMRLSWQDPALPAVTLALGFGEIARDLVIEFEAQAPMDWEEDLARGGGPCLALGAERRTHSRPVAA